MKIKMLVSYDGTDFGGWQRQNSGPPTIQGSLEEVLTRVLDQPTAVCGSGRTDAGVHARAQVAHFLTPNKEVEGRKLLHALNSLTSKGIAIHGLWEAPDEFHAMASAKKKTYTYEIHNALTPSPFKERFSVWMKDDFDLDRLNSYSAIFLGSHDFKSFQTRGSEVRSTVREIFEALWERPSSDRLVFRMTGSGFLRQMVRNIVGTLLDLHRDRAQPSVLEGILKAMDRGAAGVTALPQGLCLDSVSYPLELDNKCRKL